MKTVYAAVQDNYEYIPEYMHVTREGVERWLDKNGYIISPREPELYIHRDSDPDYSWKHPRTYYIDEYELYDDTDDYVVTGVTTYCELDGLNQHGKEYAIDRDSLDEMSRKK